MLSRALRHEPWLYGIQLDIEGWAEVDAVLVALREVRREWRDLSRSDIEHLISTSARPRHEIEEGRIRATYGHSVPGKLSYAIAEPPTSLFHGTSSDAARRIADGGLLRMSRQYVHLSKDVATALDVGRRKAVAPVLFHVRAAAAHHAGVRFYVGNEEVWLADMVPVEFLHVIQHQSHT